VNARRADGVVDAEEDEQVVALVRGHAADRADEDRLVSRHA
jgi:hypothetical protein